MVSTGERQNMATYLQKTYEVSITRALSLEDPAVRRSFEAKYKATSKLYYNGQPPFDEVMNRIKDFLTKL